MSKAIAITDMPETCYDCDFCLSGRWLNYLCGLTGEEFEFIKGGRKGFCPLKPLPKKKDVEDWFDNGYNSCLDEILGDEE